MATELRKRLIGNRLLMSHKSMSVIFFFAAFIGVVSPAHTLTLLYSGEEHGHLDLHGCGAEQIGGLAHRYTLIDDLRTQHKPTLNLHTGNLVDPTDVNIEWVYQIGLSALEAMQIDAFCLGPNELSLSRETLETFHANHPDIAFICTNLTDNFAMPYLICEIISAPRPGEAATRQKIAVVGLVSETFAHELPDLTLIPPQAALEELKTELLSNSDIVIAAFHATEEETRILAKSVSWIDILIVSGNNKQKPPTESESKTIFSGKTTIVTNVAQGAAVGILSMENDKASQEYMFTNYYQGVSEYITANTEIAQLLEAYQQLTTPKINFQTDTSETPGANPIHLTYFHKQGCQKCVRAVKVLKKLYTKYPNIVVDQRNAKTEQALLEAMGTLYEVPDTKRMITPAVFIGGTALIGELDTQQLETVVEQYLETGADSRLAEAETQLDAAETEIVHRFLGFGTLAVAGAGLLDGVNPCAFATIVFFVSYMHLVGRSRKEMLIAGGAFTLSVFLTYLLLGFGTLSFIRYLNRFSGIATSVYLLTATATFALGGLSLYDAVKAKQGKTKDILLQLPRTLKLRIHKVIREQTRTSGVVIGALVIGFTISALELVCTGQVYLPTLTFVAGIDEMRGYALAYLLLYNLMFILPLLAVFGCVYWGTTSLQLGGVLQRHLAAVKVGIGIILLGLGTWLVLSIL